MTLAISCLRAVDVVRAEKIIGLERMRLVDPDEPPFLPAGARVVTLDETVTIAPDWQWADRVDWRQALAFKTVEGPVNFDECSCCGEIAVDLDDDEQAETMICAACWEDGEFDGDLDADERDAKDD